MPDAPKTGLLFDKRCKQHETGEDHPECPERLDAVHAALKKAGLLEKLAPVEAREATDAELEAVHAQAYLATAKKDIAAGRRQLNTGDTQVSGTSWTAACLAAGGLLNAVDAVAQGTLRNAFCAVRPPGHHASAARGMGFCILNNVALAARYAQRKHKLAKVAIADWDVHHGNGTQDIFYEDETVLFFSTHQSPWYPGTGAANETGAGKGLGATINCPFAAGAGRKEILGAFADKFAPAVAKFKPDLLLLSAGFDSRAGDPLGKFTLADEDFAALTKLLLSLAQDHAAGRLISVLEGGYNLNGLGPAAAAHVTELVTASSGA
ncbi:MAG: histone deacetylase [Planctomycetota bacterium]|nr:histone deacetylase [Planctomycetota bacterium]